MQQAPELPVHLGPLRSLLEDGPHLQCCLGDDVRREVAQALAVAIALGVVPVEPAALGEPVRDARVDE